jgi:FkbM family methyltransferase
MDILQWLLTAGLLAAVVVLGRESRLLARRRRELARRVETLERAHLETHRRRVLDDARARLARAGRSPQLELVCRGQGLEDCYLWELFGGKLDGRFIEAGAADGVRNSVTWLLEAAGWTGVLVEADPETAAQCARNRPHSHVTQTALGPPGGPATVQFTRVLGAGDADHLSYAPDLARVRSVYARKARRTEQIEVPLRPLTDVLADAAEGGAGAGAYDVAVIDVEGAELALLEGFDLARFPTAVLLIEDLTGGTDEAVQRLVEGAGYQRAGRVERNTIYIRRDRPDLLGRAAETGWWPSEDRPGR